MTQEKQEHETQSTFKTNKLFTSRNIQVTLFSPSVIIGFLYKGKIGAYHNLLSKILQKLSEHETKEIVLAFKSSIEQHSLIMPPNIGHKIFDKSKELTNLIMLYYLVRIYKLQRVIETGVWTGKTTWSILKAMEYNGTGELISIDLGVKKVGNSKLPIKEIGGLVPSELRHRWHLIIGDAKKVLPELVNKIKVFDLFYHDSNHSYEHMMFEFTIVLPHLCENGILSSDDVSSNSAFENISHSLYDTTVIDKKFGYGFKSLRQIH